VTLSRGRAAGAAYLDISQAPAEFRLAAVAAAALTPELRKVLNKRVRGRVIPRAVNAYSTSPGATSTGNRLPFVTARTVKVTQRAGVITGLRFGSARRLKGGASVSELLRPVEFGSAGTGFVTYRRVAPGTGKPHNVTRRTTNAFRPRRRTGRVIWPVTYDTVAPMVLTEWTQAVYELTREGLD
jgi:hypothetical protein